MAVEFDHVIRNGLVCDGTGGPAFQADVAVRHGRIAAVGAFRGRGAEESDARDCIVTPGFVDIHTHFDGQAIWSPRLNPSSAHGVTTVVMGNCGVGFAPCRPQDHELLISVMEGVEDIPGVVMAEGLSWEWETFPQYLDALARRPHDIDVAAYLPHSPLRVYAMGQRGADNEPASEADLALMRRLACEAVEAGALGFASSRQFNHRTRDGFKIPSFEAAENELIAIGKGLGDAGRGVMQIVMDVPRRKWAEEIPMLLRLASATGRPITYSLGSDNGGSPEWRAALELTEQANQFGAALTAQVFPRPIGMIVGHDLSVHPFCLCPTYRALAKLSRPEKMAALRTPEIRARLLAEEPGDSPSVLAKIGRDFDWMFPLSDPPDYEPAAQLRLSAQAQRRGVSPLDLAYDMLLEDDGRAMLYVALANFDHWTLDSAYAMLRASNTVVGLGDGGAHYGVVCDATFPTSLLAYWTRDRKGPKVSLEWAVQALSSKPASIVGFTDRGLLRPGYKADLNIIDYEHLRLRKPKVVFDLPAGGRRLDQDAEGYRMTMVSGSVIARDGAPTGAFPGQLVRSQGAVEHPESGRGG
jgi:N-acyl-D-amino-acid deacylase